ncbi:MAG: hypothetical protein ACOYXR_09225 [Nitrospirota bacterium]
MTEDERQSHLSALEDIARRMDAHVAEYNSTHLTCEDVVKLFYGYAPGHRAEGVWEVGYRTAVELQELIGVPWTGWMMGRPAALVLGEGLRLL